MPRLVDVLFVGLFVSFLVAPDVAVAQTPEHMRHRIGIGATVVNDHMLDRQASPLIYSGWYPAFHATYRYAAEEYQHQVSLTVGRSRMTSSISGNGVHEQEGTLLHADGAYIRRVGRGYRSRFRVFAGVATHHEYHFRRHRYTSSRAEQLGTYYAGLAPRLAGVLHTGANGRIFFQTDLPGVAVVVRPPYSIKGPLTTRIATVPDVALLSANIRYERTLGPRLSLGTGYYLRYLHNDQPRRLRSVLHAVTLALILTR